METTEVATAFQHSFLDYKSIMLDQITPLKFKDQSLGNRSYQEKSDTKSIFFLYSFSFCLGVHCRQATLKKKKEKKKERKKEKGG